MNRLRLLGVLILLLISVNFINAQSGYVGETIYLSAPSVPGILDGAAWYSVDHDNNIYVTGNTSGGRVRIDSYFSGTATVACQYAYHYYIGSTKKYGNGTIHYNISCKSSQTTLNKHNVTLKLGEKIELTYTNSSGYNLLFSTWTTSDEDIANFDGKDKVYGQETVTLCAENVGECLITLLANTGGDNPTCSVKVVANPPQSISISPELLTIKEGKTGRFTCSLQPNNSYAKLIWSSSNENVAKVSTNGLVTAVSGGTATITVKSDNGLSASGIVEVTPLPQQISLPEILYIYAGYTKVLCPTLFPENAATSYTWTSEDPKIAVVDASGNIRGKTQGTTTINVTTENGKKASCKVTVKEPSEGMDSRDTDIKIKFLKNIIKTSLNHLK